MRKNCWLLATAGVLAWLACADLFAATHSRFFITHWDTGDGLPQNSVISTIQTRDGYLWLGTLDGLARFDGVHFEKFYDSNTPGLNSTKIVQLFEDSRTNLWIGTKSAGIVLVDRLGQVQRVDLGKEIPDPRLGSICEDATGGIWLRMANTSVCAWRDGKALLLLQGAQSLITEGSNKVWIATMPTKSGSAKLIGIRLSQGGFQNIGAVEDEITIGASQLLMSSRDGGYWLIANGRVNKYRGNRVTEDWGAIPGNNRAINAACEDHDGNLVVGTGDDGIYWLDAGGGGVRISSQGISRFDRNGIIAPGAIADAGLTHNTILSLCMDREGNLWVGTDGGGLHRVNRQVFDSLETGQTVQSVCEDGAGGLWMVSGGALVSLKTGSRNAFGVKPAFRPRKSSVSVVYQDHEGRLWAGGICEATEADGRIVLLGPLFVLEGDSLSPVPGLSKLNGLVSAIFEDRTGRLWVGAEGGLACRHQGKWTVYTSRDGLSANSVDAIADDSDGNVWIGTEGGGLNCFRDGRLTVVTHTNGLSRDNISSLYADSDGILWAGTTGGLERFYRGQWTHFSKAEGLISEHVGLILEDGDGYLWLGSTAGLVRVQKKELNHFATTHTNEVFFRAYGKADGLPSAECILASQPAACRTRDGKLWFSTIRGLAAVDPASLQRNTNPPPITIESIFVEGELQNTTGLRSLPPSRITLPAKKESLEIHYTSLSFSAPLQCKFRYQMEGHESKWTEKPGEVRFARYPKLPAGSYRFQVKAYNEDNVESATVATLAVEVLPPYWQTWWFRIVLTGVVLCLVGAAVYYVSTQKLQRQLATLRQQEALERERARIARDLHDQLGANLTQVALLGELAESDKESPTDVEAHARQISHTARETTNALDEIVWTVNPSNDTLDGLINYICKYAQEYLALAELRYRIDVPPALPNTPITPELRHNVFLAAKETINNIVKHADATSAWLRLRLEPDRFVMEIEDDGRGLGADAESKGRSGLKNMRKRMEDIGGKFEIEPRAGGGTVVRLIARTS